MMTLGNMSKHLLLALLLAFSMAVALPACSSSEEESSSADSNVSCDENDTREECADDIL